MRRGFGRARVVEVRRLIMPGLPTTAHGSSWKSVLDRELKWVSFAGDRILSREVHLETNTREPELGSWVPADEQLPEEVFRFHVRAPERCPCEFQEREAVLRGRDGVPIRFVRVQPPGT